MNAACLLGSSWTMSVPPKARSYVIGIVVNGIGVDTPIPAPAASHTRSPTTAKDLDQLPICAATSTRALGRPPGAYALAFSSTSQRCLRGAKSTSYLGADRPGSP